MTDHRLLTPDELAAIRDYITGWEPARDRRFLEAARMLLDHADAQDAELARLRNDLAIIEQGCNSPWMTGAAFKDRVADIFASRALLDGADTPGEGGA